MVFINIREYPEQRLSKPAVVIAIANAEQYQESVTLSGSIQNPHGTYEYYDTVRGYSQTPDLTLSHLVNIPGEYRYEYEASSGSGDSDRTSWRINLADKVQSASLTHGTESPITPRDGAVYAYASGNVTIGYDNTWGGAPGCNLYILYKKSSSSSYSQLQAGSSESISGVFQTSVMDIGDTFNFVIGYGSSPSDVTPYVSFSITKPAVQASGKIGESTSSMINVTSGETYPYTSGVAKTIYFQYSNNFGSVETPLHILVNGVSIQDSSSQTTSASYEFTSSKIINVEYAYGAGENPTITHEFSVSMSGIITGTGVIELNGVPITTTSDNPVVSTYYENALTLTGLSGYDGTAEFEWELTTPSSPSDYELTTDDADATLKCLNPNSQYRVKCTITSYGHTVTVDMNGKYISCVSKTIALFDVEPSEGEPVETHFVIEDAEAFAPTASGNVTVKFQWSICDEYDNPVPSTSYTTVSGGDVDDDNWEFYMNVAGTFKVKLVADTTGTPYTSYQLGSDTSTIIVNNVITVSQPVQNKYAIILYNDNYTSIVNRTNSNVLFMDLKFSSGLNTIGKCTFQIVGGNNLKCNGVSSSESLLKTGTNVVIVDNLCPVWMGKISSVDDININYYQTYTKTTILNIECDEIIKELSYQYIAPDNAKTVSGKLEDIVKDYIIPEENHGSFGTSSVQYAVSLSTSSRLTALDSLSSQTGWRYRTRSNVTTYDDTIAYSDGIITVGNPSKLSVGDLIIIYDGETDESAGMYHAAIVGTISDDHITILRPSESLPDGTYHFTNYRGFLIDYRPAYYQDNVPLELDINDCAQNVDAVSTSADKFGEVSVFGVGMSGETISSNMRAWMKINPNYTIDNSARVSVSYDSTMDTINTLGDAVLNGYIWTRFAVTVNGWSFPSVVTSTHPPTIFYKRDNGDVLKMELGAVGGVISEISKFVDQSGTQKTQFIAAFIASKADGTALDPTDPQYSKYADEDGRKYIDILSSMPTLTNIVFNRMSIVSDKVLSKILPTAGNEIMIGDSIVKLASLSANGELTFNWILEDDGGDPVKVAPHGHLTDVLVIDNTGTKHNTFGYKYDNPDPDSPFGKYGDVTISIQGPEGYSRMELERLACRYMQYGSNYSDRGSCAVILNAFLKSDYDIGCKKILTPGDRFVLNKVIASDGNSTISTALNYELLSYNVSLNTNMVSVSFGMPFIEIGDMLYNMLSNSGLSILSASSDIQLQ